VLLSIGNWDALVQVVCRLAADYILVDVPDLGEEGFPVKFVGVV
jgi:hypothetical protein